MNHLKHIRGISVRASSNAALSSHYGQHINIHFENYKLKSQLLRSDPLFAIKKSHDIDVKYLRQFRQGNLRFVSKESKTICKQRSKTKSSMTSLKKKSSMHKKLPSENIAKRVYHYSTCQNVKFNSNEINKQFMTHNVIINGTKDINRHSSFMATIEKYPRPRSYAEMIADYSESLYKESTVGVRKDSFYFNNAIRKSPFSTFSVPPQAKKIINVAKYSELSIERQKNDFPFPVKSFDLYNQRNNKNINRNCVSTNDDLKSDDQSYAKLIAHCSKSLHNIPITNVLNDNLVSKRNMLARHSFESVITATRRTSGTQETMRKIIPATSTISFEKNIKEKVINLKENDWLKEMENVLSDLKNVTDRKVARVDVPKTKKSDNQREKDTTIRKLNQSDKIDRMEKRKKVLELQRHNYSHSSGKISNLPQYFGNAAESSVVKKNSTLASTSSNIDVFKQPQVKLRMVPSEKESVVSINVDQDSFGSLDPLNSTSKHLSVVVQSDQKEDVKLMDNQWNTSTRRHINKSALQNSAFGPMHISISEDSAPVKQIEFSINGKPVSELKSITARTEKLDVVSSADKIEIRIPFVKDDSNVLDKTRESDLPKGIKPKGQILNVQISANFQDEYTKDSNIEKPAKAIQQNKDTIPISLSPISKTYLSNNFSKVREETFSSNNIQQYEYKQMDIKFDDNEKNIKKYRTGTSLIKEINNVKVKSLNTKSSNTTEFPEANKYNKNEFSDNRVPSKMIPWWSSSNSFNKIRKKENDHRPLTPPSNKNQFKPISNMNQNFITESTSKKKISNSNVLSKRIQLMNNTTTNNSSNASPNSINPYEESKPPLHYACSFRLKSNQGNPNMPEIIRNDFKAEDKQALTTKKDINKISGIKQMDTITLFKSNTMNIKSKHDIGIKEKTFLQEKIKPPSSAQNLSSKTHQEKKNYYSLKQTRSIDDVSKNIKSKIEDILNVIKPIENNKNGIIDYGLKKMSSRQLTAKLNNPAKEIQNPITTIKNFIPNSAEIVSKKIDKTTLTKQTEPTNTEKLKLKSDISLKKENLTMKNNTIINLKALDNNVNNIQEVYKNDFTSSNSPNFRNFPKLSQTLKKQEQFTNNNIIYQDKSKQDLKSLSKINKNEHSSSINSSLKISSGMMQKSEISGKVLLQESKQNKPKNLTSIKNTPEMNQEVEKIKNLTSSKSANPFKESSNTIMIDKLPLQTEKQIQSKPSKNANMTKIANINKLSSSQTVSISKTKDCIISKNLIDNNAREISQSVETKRKMRDMIVNIVTEKNPKNKNLLPKKCEENFKTRSDKGYFLSSAGSSRKPNVSSSFKSAGSNRKSRSAIFKVRQNLNDVDMQDYPAPNVIRSNGLWINIDRPEKSILYSAWLQRFKRTRRVNAGLGN
ncbi:PREDICTED: protein PFF0380w-like isoform X1 [Trachymyrmex septentrionalis]|uniref:protein PFF0380w-like isoform X1 n=1 Tax=Trachymyrmex septentrionalis TaxID=34720 RepID=UPI00084EF664|nr:PREDICTED: protein PFF0380w-like isoform X1 [Trachymyrmex septentrionalis]